MVDDQAVASAGSTIPLGGVPQTEMIALYGFQRIIEQRILLRVE
jgi:hypothetical protein